jgi:glutamate N-acetyltransferase/amino-acid N-acetyltransferase
VLAATGSVPLSTPLDPTRVSVSFVPTDGSPVLPLLVNGEPEEVDEVRAKEILSAEDLEVRVDLNLGSECAKYWTCDFSYVSPSTSERRNVRIVDGGISYTGIR